MPWPFLQLTRMLGCRFWGREHWPFSWGHKRKLPVQFPSFLQRITLELSPCGDVKAHVICSIYKYLIKEFFVFKRGTKVAPVCMVVVSVCCWPCCSGPSRCCRTWSRLCTGTCHRRRMEEVDRWPAHTSPLTSGRLLCTDAWRLSCRNRHVYCETIRVKFQFDYKRQLCKTHLEWLLLCFAYVCAPLWLVGHMVSWFAFVFAEGAHFETCLIAAFGLQHGVGHGRRHRTAELTQSFWERPQTVLHTGQSVISAYRWQTYRTNQI